MRVYVVLKEELYGYEKIIGIFRLPEEADALVKSLGERESARIEEHELA